MRDHPIPQDIVGYQFHIVGNMTIKQFAEMAAGAGIAFLLYLTNLYPPIKWTLIGISFATGAAAAFLPFEERPLDHWLYTLVTVLYRPTKYFWKKSAKVPDPFLYKPMDESQKTPETFDLNPARRARIHEYLQSVPQETDSFDQARQAYIDSILATFNSTRVTAQGKLEPQKAKPRLKVRVRSLRYSQAYNADTGLISEETEYDSTDKVDDIENKERNYLQLHTPLAVAQVAQDVAVPEVQEVVVESPVEETVDDIPHQEADEQAYVDTIQSTAQPSATQDAVFNQDLPFPSKPTEPNKLVGMILSPQNELINDAIVEIVTPDGQTIRAVKTNALGQFFITTPLPNGDYVIKAEKEELDFSPLNLQLTGEIVEPIEIRSIV